MTTPDLSILIPVYNEGELVGKLLEEILQKKPADLALEIIVINDGSDDDTAAIVGKIAETAPSIRLITHPERSGKSAALRTGALAANAIWIGTLDGDGQDDPDDLFAMAREVDLSSVGEIGLVGGVRRSRTDGSSRKFASRFANGLRQWLLKDDCPDTACGLKLLPRAIFLQFPFFDALHRYLPAFARHFGFETRYVPVTNRPRAAGVSKYSNVGRAIAGIFDLTGVVWLKRRTKTPGRAFMADMAVQAGRSNDPQPDH